MKTLRINVKDKIATYFQRDGVIVCGNKDYTIAFTFDEEWDEYTTKTARFVWNGKYYDKEFTGDECPVPVINDATEVTVGVYAGDLKTTTPAEIPCLISILCGNPEVIEGNIKEYRDIAQQAAAEAQQAAEEAKAAAEVVVHPTIDVEEIEGGHRLTINDADGEKTFDVMDGEGGSGSGNVTIDEVDASKVVFGETVYTGYAVGNITLDNGRGILVNEGESLLTVMKNIYSKTVNPTTVQPSISLTFSQAKAYEVGSTVTPSYSAIFNKGSYSFDDDTGVTVTGWTITDTAGNDPKTIASDSFPSFIVTDDISYKITAKATHTAGIIPHDNMGGKYSAGQIKKGSVTATSKAVTGYRNTFYGTLDDTTPITNDNASSIIRPIKNGNDEGKSNQALYKDSIFTITIPVGARRVLIAYPAALDGTTGTLTSVKDVNGLNAEIAGSFKKQTLTVKGAGTDTGIPYSVYILEYANANDTANKYTVTI